MYISLYRAAELSRSRERLCQRIHRPPTLRAPGVSVPDGRTTIRQNRRIRADKPAPPNPRPVTNPLERSEKRSRRRADVVGIFPNDAAIIWLIGAVLLDQNDEWQSQHYSMPVEVMAGWSQRPHIPCAA